VKITGIETLLGDGGYRVCSYVKVSTDEGVTGWAEYYDGLSGVSVTPLIRDFARTAAGMDPRAVGRLSESLLATTRLSWGGLAHQAVAAIENACLDIKAKALGVPVCALFGGPFRERVPVYWTHCGSYRVRHAAFYENELGLAPVRTLDDFTRLGREAVAQGFHAVKTNPVFFDRDKPYMFNGGFRIEPGFLDRSISDRNIEAIADQLQALRAGIGPDRGLMLDVSFSQRTEGYLRLARAPLAEVLPHARAGKLRILATTARERSALAPDIPTFLEQGFEKIVVQDWSGFLAPAGTPPEVVARANAAINAAVESARVKEAMAKLGMEVGTRTPAAFSETVRESFERYRDIVKASGFQAEQ
jgi:hypothetical protein